MFVVAAVGQDVRTVRRPFLITDKMLEFHTITIRKSQALESVVKLTYSKEPKMRGKKVET